MSEETLLSVEGSHDRATIAAYFRQVAEGLEGDGSVTFSTDHDKVSLTIPETPEFEVEIEQEIEDDETEYEIEFEIEWSTADHASEAAAETLEIGSEAESEEPAAAEPSADDEAQQTLDEGDAEGGSDAESDSDADMDPIDPPHGRSEVDAAENDESSQDTDEHR